MKLSVSMLTSYMYCKRKLYLQYVLGLIEPVKESTIKGTIRHETYDLINKEEEKIVKSIKSKKTLEELKEIYKKETSGFLRNTISKYKEELKKVDISSKQLFKNTWPLIIEESEARANNVFNFIEKNLIFGEELWEKLTPKIKSEVYIDSDKLNLKGVIDQIEIYEEGIVPIELKTGNCPKEDVWPNHKIQVGAYALLLEEKFKQKVKAGFVNYLDAKQKRQITINSFLLHEITSLISKVQLTINSAKVPEFTTNPNKCNSCGLKQQCYDNSLINNKIKTINKTNLNRKL